MAEKGSSPKDWEGRVRHRHYSQKDCRDQEFLKWLHEVEYIKIPLHTAFLNNEVRMKDRPDRDLSYEEVKALIDYYRNHPFNHALLTLLATTGFRIQEIAKGRWCDLYYDSGIGEYYLYTELHHFPFS